MTYIWGDYEYDDEVTDEDVWGDADVIDANITNSGAEPEAWDRLEIWAGDGDDEVITGNTWLYQEVHGGNDDDTITFGDNVTDIYIRGDAGEDTIAP